MFFCSVALSRPDNLYIFTDDSSDNTEQSSIPLYRPDNFYMYHTYTYPPKYLFYLSTLENEPLETYKIVSALQKEDYLIFNIKKISFDDLRHSYTSRGDLKCFLNKDIPKKELERIVEYSKIVFSIKDLEKYNLSKTVSHPLPPLSFHKDSKAENSIEEPGDPAAPLPAPLPFYEDFKAENSIEEPGDPAAPLPAPLPFYENPETETFIEEPGDPIAPLPAPLPFYINPSTSEYFILHKNNKGLTNKIISLNLTKAKWSDDVAPMLIKYFYRPEEKTCDN